MSTQVGVSVLENLNPVKKLLFVGSSWKYSRDDPSLDKSSVTSKDTSKDDKIIR